MMARCAGNVLVSYSVCIMAIALPGLPSCWMRMDLIHLIIMLVLLSGFSISVVSLMWMLLFVLGLLIG